MWHSKQYMTSIVSQHGWLSLTRPDAINLIVLNTVLWGASYSAIWLTAIKLTGLLLSQWSWIRHSGWQHSQTIRGANYEPESSTRWCRWGATWSQVRRKKCRTKSPCTYLIRINVFLCQQLSTANRGFDMYPLDVLLLRSGICLKFGSNNWSEDWGNNSMHPIWTADDRLEIKRLWSNVSDVAQDKKEWNSLLTS